MAFISALSSIITGSLPYMQEKNFSTGPLGEVEGIVFSKVNEG